MARGVVAFVVLSHRGPAQVGRLVSRLARGTGSMVAIHHDPTGEPLRPPGASNVAMVPDPVPCGWGRLSIVHAVRRSLGWVRANVPDLGWVLVISGQDYPITTVARIESELAGSPRDGYLRHFPIGDPADDVDPWQGATRHRYLYRRRVPGTARSVPLPWRRPGPFGAELPLTVGDMWVNLSARAVHKVLDHPREPELRRYLRRSPVPDECYVPTLACAGAPVLDIAPDSRRYITWRPPASHPETLGMADLPALAASDAFFARKIDAERDPGLCDRLDALAATRP